MRNLNWWKKAWAVFVVCTVAATVVPAQTFTSLFSFDGANGAQPDYMSLVQGIDGAFYGTTLYGGSGNTCGRSGCGTAFKITSGGTLATLRLTPADGVWPVAGLTLATNGNFYGASSGEGANGGGTVFEITKVGKKTVLYSFCAQTNCTDGFSPQGRLVQAADGDFYGTTAYGGVNDFGTVFKVTTGGTLTTLHSFDGTDGLGPFDGLVQGVNGSFYGTTYSGGAYASGTVFKITPGDTLTTLYSFNNFDGKSPTAGLIQAADGDLYGTTIDGGANGNGTIFKITRGGTLTTLHNFCSQPGCTDGGYPYAGLVQASDGNFYGTNEVGGTSNQGTIFEISPGGTLTTLRSFAGADGAHPFGGLLQSTGGIFYGTTLDGGDFTCNPPHGCGTVFSLDMDLSPFVTFVRAAGRVGQTGGILGQGFTATTSVSLNGTPASFTVVSDTYIRATVPAGAATGYVTVTTPSGTLTSNVPFHVIK